MNQLKSEIDQIYTLEFKQEMDMAIYAMRDGWIKQNVNAMRSLIIKQNQLIKDLTGTSAGASKTDVSEFFPMSKTAKPLNR